MIMEGMTYTLFFFMWMVTFFIQDLLFVAMAASGGIFPYIVFCWIHECFFDASANLRQTLHQLEWFTMSVKQRVQLLVMVDHPKLLRTGPFHIVCYNELGNVFRRVYSIGLCINKSMK